MRRSKGYLLAVLLAILVFNKADNAVLGVLLENIKVDLALTDTQLGLLTGIAFTLFYSVMGLPIARWADRGSRVTIISISTALQCVAVALCGFAGNFMQLLSIRIGVAVGEAGCVPPANSLIADYFTRAERPRATARYMLGYPLSAVFGYFLAGWLNELYGWRVTMVLLGLPGVLLAILAYFTLQDPRHHRSHLESEMLASAPYISEAHNLVSSPTHQTLTEVLVTLWMCKTFRNVLLGYALVTFFGIGVWLWAPTFFIRSYGLQTGEVGTWFAMIWGVGGLLGTYWGGEMASRRAASNERLQLKVMSLTYAFFGVIAAGMYLAPNHYVAFGLLALTAVANFAVHGPLFATIQTLVSPNMRAVAFATLYLFANLIGMGLGPLAAGALSDALQPTFGSDSLRYALLALCPGYVWAAWHLLRASRTVTRDLQLVLCTDRRDSQDGPSAFCVRGEAPS